MLAYAPLDRLDPTAQEPLADFTIAGGAGLNVEPVTLDHVSRRVLNQSELATAEVVTELLLEGYNPVIFCRFIDTAEYVAEHLARRLGNGYAVAAVTGTLPPDERTARIAELTKDGKKRPVLVAT